MIAILAYCSRKRATSASQMYTANVKTRVFHLEHYVDKYNYDNLV